MILAAILGVTLYALPTYQSAQELKAQEQELASALTNARELQAARDELLQRFNSFTTNDITRLETLLPNNIDNVKLIIELDALARRYGLRIENIDTIEQNLSQEEEQARQALPYESIDLAIGVEGTYERFVEFIEQVERSLRLIDVQNISFRALETGNNYKYDMTVRTYWLK